jgi:hypothetical protein
MAVQSISNEIRSVTGLVSLVWASCSTNEDHRNGEIEIGLAVGFEVRQLHSLSSPQTSNLCSSLVQHMTAKSVFSPGTLPACADKGQ